MIDNGNMSSLGNDIDENEYYGRDRGEDDQEPKFHKTINEATYCQYGYLYTNDGGWEQVQG